MKPPGWATEVGRCIREKQFWRDTVTEIVHSTASPSGFGMALLAVLLKIGQRVFAIEMPRG